VIYTAIGATVLALMGMTVGVWRWRFSGRFEQWLALALPRAVDARGITCWGWCSAS